MKRASIGVSAHLGWAASAVMVCDERSLRVLRSDRLATAPQGDRQALEPYHVAGGFDGLRRVPQPDDAKGSLRSGLRKQQRFTARAIAKLAAELAAEGYRLAFAGLLVSRGRDAASFEKSIGSHTQIHIQEGLAVRASLRDALKDAGARIRDIDQKSLVAIASEELALSEAALMARLGDAPPENGGAWRKEEKLAALAAWLAWRSNAR